MDGPVEFVVAALKRADVSEWITSGAYLFAAVLCLWAARWAWIARSPNEKIFWLASSLLMAFFSVNDVLDLQQLLTVFGKSIATEGGWYEERRYYQAVFVVALIASGCIAFALVLWLTRTMDSSIRLALFGYAFIGIFVLFQAASFHHMDEFLGLGYQKFNLGAMQEVSGMMIVAAASLTYVRSRKRHGTARLKGR